MNTAWNARDKRYNLVLHSHKFKKAIKWSGFFFQKRSWIKK